MARKSAIVTYYVDDLPWPLDPETGEPAVGTPAALQAGIWADPNMVMVTLPDHPLPVDEEYARERHVFEADPSHDTPDQLPGTPASVTVIGAPWTVEAVAQANPNAAPYVMDAVYTDGTTHPETGEPVRFRTREIAVPPGATVLESGIPSHRWGGDD